MTAIDLETTSVSNAREGKGLRCFSGEAFGERTIVFLVFLLSSLHLLPFYNYTILNADKGIVLQGAQRILQGQVLYRDFFSFLTPGSYYWMALLFRICGSSILVGRSVLLVYGGVFSVLTYVLAHRLSSRWSALFASYIVTVTCLPFRFVVHHNWDSTLLAYLALYCAVLLLERDHWVWSLGTGLFAALTFLFEQSKGTGLILGLLAGFFVALPRDRLRRLLRAPQAAALATGFALPFIATLSYFAAKRSLPQMLSGWTWPAFHYSLANKLPYGHIVVSSPESALFTGSWISHLIIFFVIGPCILLPMAPILSLGFLGWSILKPSRNKVLGEKRTILVMICAVASGLLSSILLTGRADFTHLNYLAPVFYLVLAWLIGGWNIPARLGSSIKPIFVFWVLLSATAFGAAMLWGTLQAHYKLPTARGTLRTAVSESGLQYLQAHIAPGEKILVYPYEPLFYYLTATFSATHFDFLQPGMHTPDQFQEVVRELESDPPRVAVFETSFTDKISFEWPNTPIKAVAARDPVADYLFRNYRVCSALTSNAYWHFIFMVRKETSCPSEPRPEESDLRRTTQ